MLKYMPFLGKSSRKYDYKRPTSQLPHWLLLLVPLLDKERCKSYSKYIYIRPIKSMPHQRITNTHIHDSLLLLSLSFLFFLLLLFHQHLCHFIIFSFTLGWLIIRRKSFSGIVRLMRNIYNVISLHTFAYVYVVGTKISWTYLHNIFEFIVDRKRLDMNSLCIYVFECFMKRWEMQLNLCDGKLAVRRQCQHKRDVWLTHAFFGKCKWMRWSVHEKRNKIAGIDTHTHKYSMIIVNGCKANQLKLHKWVILVDGCPITRHIHVHQPHLLQLAVFFCVLFLFSLFVLSLWHVRRIEPNTVNERVAGIASVNILYTA